MRLVFDRGTLICLDLPPDPVLTDLPGVIWDPRTGCLRAPAWKYRDLLAALRARGVEVEDYFELERAVCGPGAYPLKGSKRVTKEIHHAPLFRVAEDVVDRVGIRQGVIAPDDDDEMVPTEGIMSATEAAEHLGISRSAVIKAAQAGRLKGKKIGKTWALLKRSVRGYQVAAHRVAAGKAAHKK